MPSPTAHLDALAAVLRIDERTHRDGFVSFPAVRRELATMSRAAVDGALLALQRSGALMLKIANDPTCTYEGTPADGIRSDRGLLFYAVLA